MTRSILATGYRAALGFLEGVVSVDGCGFGRRRDRVVSLDHPNLFFVGHNYDARGGLYNISLDAPRAAREVGRALQGTELTVLRGDGANGLNTKERRRTETQRRRGQDHPLATGRAARSRGPYRERTTD